MDQYAVVGNPISHSKSPLIHGLFAEQTQQSMAYTTIESPLDDFQGTVRTFFSQPSNKGLNVTVPFKEEAWAMCDFRSEGAELAGAVNTLYLNESGQICGDNTDGVGLVRDIQVNNECAIKGKRVLVIGAGGAVRGVLQPLLKAQPDSIVVCNRTVSKAEALSDLFANHGSISACSFEAVAGQFDVVINGTSASLSGNLPAVSNEIFTADTVVYDMMYGKEETVFNAWARESGAGRQIDGLGMLAEQAAEAFRIWRGIRPETAEILEELRKN